MFNFESDTIARAIRTLTANESIGEMDAARIATNADLKIRREQMRPRPVVLRPSYDIRSPWRTVAATA